MSTVSIGTLKGYLLLEDTLTPALTRASTRLTTTGKRLNELGQQTSAAGRAMLPLSAAVGAMGVGAVKAAMDFESSFAGVRKTVNATEGEFAALSTGFREMSKAIPVSVNELNTIGESAGQLGIETEHILGFTRTMADLGVTTNLSSDQAATALARLANITGLPQTEFDRLGSTIVDLGNNLATTESEIVDFGLRIAGAGEIAGLSEAQILAIGAAMSSVGVQAEAGGTAVQKVLLGMTEAVSRGGDKLHVFASTAGLSAREFASAFEQDAGAAFAAFTAGIGEQGITATATLEALNFTDQRLIKSFLSLGGAGEVLTQSLQIGTQAFEDNTALATEAAQRYATFESQAKILWGRLRDVAITVGTSLLPSLNQLLTASGPLVDQLARAAHWFADLPQPVRATALAVGVLMAATAPVLIGLGTLISLAGLTVTSLGTLSGALAGTTTAMAAAGTAAPAAAAGVGLLGGSLRALTLAAGPVGIAIAGMWAAWKVFQWATARNEVASVEARIAGLSERIANISNTGARATRMKQHLTAALRDEEAALTAANAAAAAAVRNAPAEIARLEAEIEALPTLSRNYDNVVRAKQREIAENRQLLADREEQVTAIREETAAIKAAIEASQKAIWDAAVASMRATKTNDDFAASVEGSTAAVDALDTSVDRFTGGTSNSRNALMGFIGTLQPLPQLGIEAAMAVDALDTSFDRFTGGTSNSQNALRGFIGTLQDLPAAATTAGTEAGTAAADGFLSGMGESFAGFGKQIGQTFARALEGGGGFLGATQSLGVQAGDRLGTSLSEGLSTRMTADTGFLSKGLGKVLGDAAGMAIPLIGPVIGQLVGKLFSLGGPSAAELAGRQVAGRFRQGLLAELNPAQMAEVQQAIQGAWKGNEIGAATVIAIRDAYIAAGASADDALDVVNRLWQAEQQGGAAVQEVIDEITTTIKKETVPGLDALAETGRGTFEELTGTIDIMQAKIANTDSLDRMAAEFRKASDGSTYDLGTILREAESLTDSLGSTHPAVVQMQGLIRDASETGVWDFGQMALAIGAMKDEMATPIVIPVTPVLTGMIDPGREGNDRLSPSNFRTREAWEANWLARNPGDAHRADEALGGHQFADGTGGLRQFSPFGTPAWLHGEEEVLTRQQGQGVATMVGAQLENARAQFAVASRHMETAGAGMAGAAGLGAPIVVHLHTHIDGRRAAEAVVRRIPGVLAVHGVA